MPAKPAAANVLHAENAELRARLEEAEEMLRAIRAGEVDALIVEGSAGPQIYALQGLDAESNRFRGEILSQVSDAVVTLDGEHHVTYLNTAAEQQYGVTASDVLGRHQDEVYQHQWLHPEDEAAKKEALRKTGNWRGEMIHIKHNGEKIRVEVAATSLHMDNGAQPGLLAVIRDITKRKQAEDALSQNVALFSKIIEQAPGGVYVVDAQFRMQQINAVSIPVFAAVEPLIGRDFNEVMEILWGPEVGAECAAVFRNTLATGERYVSPRFSHQRHDIGVEQAFEWQTQRITLPDGQHGVVCYFEDVTERIRAGEALRTKNQELERFNRVAVDRELRMVELKKEINALCIQAGEAPRYRVDFG